MSGSNKNKSGGASTNEQAEGASAPEGTGTGVSTGSDVTKVETGNAEGASNDAPRELTVEEQAKAAILEAQLKQEQARQDQLAQAGASVEASHQQIAVGTPRDVEVVSLIDQSLVPVGDRTYNFKKGKKIDVREDHIITLFLDGAIQDTGGLEDYCLRHNVRPRVR